MLERGPLLSPYSFTLLLLFRHLIRVLNVVGLGFDYVLSISQSSLKTQKSFFHSFHVVFQFVLLFHWLSGLRNQQLIYRLIDKGQFLIVLARFLFFPRILLQVIRVL